VRNADTLWGGKVLWSFLSGNINKFRASLGLAKQESYVVDAAPQLCLYSEQVPLHHHITHSTTTAHFVEDFGPHSTRWWPTHMTGRSI
jgi:hypothetical protein